MIERDDLRFQLLLLTRLFEDEPARELKPKCLILVDQVATYASHLHRGLPQPIAEILASAMHAAMRADVAAVIHNVETALTQIDSPKPLVPSKASRPKAQGSPRKAPAGSTAVVTAKPIKQTTDKLLAALRKSRSTSQ